MRTFLIVILVSLASIATAKPAPSTPLGRIVFPTSGPPVAQQHFVRGMLAMHSFFYEEAREEFQAATRAAPDFAMGYWGEALTYYHPIWMQEDAAASRAALAKIPATTKATERELAYVASARALAETSDQGKRTHAYMLAMRALHVRFPSDDEAATLYAVSLLGDAIYVRSHEHAATNFRPFAEAAAIALEVFHRNPDHPGAAHYIIHAFDDPAHAILALPAARRYAAIAPEAYHARHMPAHIFVQLGMWDEAIASNESAWAASVAWATKKHLDASYHDFHSLSWLQAIYLDRGVRTKALEQLEHVRADLLTTSGERHARMRALYAGLVVNEVMTTSGFDRLDALLAPLAAPPRLDPQAKAEPPVGPTCHTASVLAAKASLEEAATVQGLRVEAALAKKDLALAKQELERLAIASKQASPDDQEGWKLAKLFYEGRMAALRGDVASAVLQLTKAAELDEREPPSGPVLDGITVREWLGDVLLAAKRAPEALAAYRRALYLHPRRLRALTGAARAATAANDPSAPGYWAEARLVGGKAEGVLHVGN